jgi:hypothetical protein
MLWSCGYDTVIIWEMSAGREVVMGQKIGIYLYHQENVRCYIPVVSDSENKIHIGNETWQKFCIKIS